MHSLFQPLAAAPGRGPAAWAAAVLFLAVVSTNEFALVELMHRANLGKVTADISGILEGRPTWAAYQSRLLGPAMHRALDWILHQALASELPANAAMKLFLLAAIAAKNALLFALTALHTRSGWAAAALTLAGSVLCVVLGGGDHLLYHWDLLDVILFTGLAFLMARWRAANAVFLALFAVALLNRETAAFFGLWLISLDAARSCASGRVHWRDGALGVLLILLTAASVVALRDWLLIEELGTRPYVGVAGNHLTILLNLSAFLRNLVSLKLYVDAWVLLILAYGLALLRWGARTGDARRLAQGLFALGLLAAIVAFGVINETRMFLMFVPLLVFSAADAWLERRRAGAAVRQS